MRFIDFHKILYTVIQANDIWHIPHFVSRHYLQRYVDEAVFRYNNRKKKGGEPLTAFINVVTFEEVKVVKCAA